MGSVVPTPCAAGRYGAFVGMASELCSGVCAPGSFCVSGSISAALQLCPAGSFGAASGLQNSTCSGPCPRGSYCPTGTVIPILCGAGRYGSVLQVFSATCTGPCGLGHWCPIGSTSDSSVACAAGLFGDRPGLENSNCSGACAAGYYCPLASLSSNANACAAGRYGATAGLASATCTDLCLRTFYCPPATASPVSNPCPPGAFSAAVGHATAACSGLCRPGYWCPPGSLNDTFVACAPGRYGSTAGLPTASCTDACNAGFWCPAHSTKPGERTCAAGRYSASSGLGTADCSGPCDAGFYCPPGATSAQAAACPPGTFGNATGLATDACSGYCPLGYWCPASTTYAFQRPCSAGFFGDTVGRPTETCSGPCEEGFFCPVGSTSSRGHPCNGSNVYCPKGQGTPLTVPPGFFSSPVGGERATNAYPCPVGYYCADGVQYLCVAGRFGSDTAGSDPSCSGACMAGYYCPTGSSSATAVPCGNTSVYCPAGAGAPILVDRGYFSEGSMDGTAQVSESLCNLGKHCALGVQLLCPFGTYGATRGLAIAACSGDCAPGYVCGPGAKTATAADCPFGSYCRGGSRVSLCPRGTFNAMSRASALENCTACPMATAGPLEGARLLSDCVACVPPESSFAGAVSCWPGVVSVVASNPPPIFPMLSSGDIVTITFSRPTNRPAVDTEPELRALVNFSAPVGTRLRGAWNGNAQVMIITIGAVDELVSKLDTRIGALLISFNVSAGLRDKALTSQAAVLPPVAVTGDWGIPKVPEFYAGRSGTAGAFARNTGGQAGLGVGDSLVLRFDNPCKQVALQTKDDVDRLLVFSSAIGADYTGAWDPPGSRFRQAGLTIVIVAALAEPNAFGTAVGKLIISVRQSAELNAIDNSTAASNSSIVLALGTWGDLPDAIPLLRSYRSVRMMLSPPATRFAWTVTAYRVEWSPWANFSGEGLRALEVAAVAGVETAQARLEDLTAGAPGVWFRVAAYARIIHGTDSEVLSDGWGPFLVLPSAVVTAPPVVRRVEAQGGGSRMAARGGQVIVITGDFLGLPESPEIVRASYSNGNTTYAGEHCRVTVPGTEVKCDAVAGVGSEFVWTLSVDGAAATGLDAMHYNIPVLQEIVRIDVMGSHVYRIHGREFGPLGTVINRAWLTLPSDLRASFTSPGCRIITADTEVECEEPIGAGGSLVWTLIIGWQLSAAPTVTYDLPVVHNITCAPAPCDALRTVGGDTVTISGKHFGPALASYNYIAGTLGGVLLLRDARDNTGNERVQLVHCAVTAVNVEIVCTVPAGFGVRFRLVVTAVGQSSAPSAQLLSFALPAILSIGTNNGGDIVTSGNVLRVAGASFGAPARLILNSARDPRVREAALGDLVAANAGQSSLDFLVPELPLRLVGAALVGVCVEILGIRSNTFDVHSAPPAFATRDPIAVEDAMPVECVGVPSIGYYLVLAGQNFGVSTNATSVVISEGGGEPLPCAVCAVTARSIHLSTDKRRGVMTVHVGDLVSSSVLYDVDALLQPPRVTAVWDAPSGNPLVTTPAVGGGVLRVLGFDFHASYRLFIVPRSLAYLVPLDAKESIGVLPKAALLMCVINASTLSSAAFECTMPPGIGSDLPLVFFARGRWYGTRKTVSYTPPSIASATVVGGAPLLTSAGGYVQIVGENFGNWTANVTVRIGAMDCRITRPIYDTAIRCMAPPGDEGVPALAVTVAGQTAVSRATGLGYYPPTCEFVTPNSSGTNGGVVMVIVGRNFGYRKPTVHFLLPYGIGSPEARVVESPVEPWLATAVRIEIPPGVGGANATSRVSIRVSTTSQSVTVASSFAYHAAYISSAAGALGGCPVGGCGVRIAGGNFGGTLSLRVTIGGSACVVTSASHREILCASPPGSGKLNAVVVSVAFSDVSGAFLVYDGPTIADVLPRVVDQRVASSVIIVGANFAARGLRISFSGTPCGSTPEFINSSAVRCASSRFISIGPARVRVEVDAQASEDGVVAAVCRQGSYGRVADVVCATCPQHAVCVGGALDPAPLAGYWRSARGVFVACIPPDACVAMDPYSNETNCALEYVGEQCRFCAKHFYRVGDFCVPCPNNAALLVVLFIAFLLGVGALATWMHRNMFNLKGAYVPCRARARGRFMTSCAQALPSAST